MASRYFELVFDLPLPGRYSYTADPKGEASLGKRAIAPFGRREILGYIVGESETAPEGLEKAAIKALKRTVDAEALFGLDELKLATWMAGYYICGMGEALAAMIPSGRRESGGDAFADAELDTTSAELSLSDEQKTALEAISPERPETRDSRPLYLFGITGSGKTEVFLRAAERTIAANKTVIYLVPEIALSHQVAEAVARRFGSLAATLHSGLSPSERLRQWTKIRRGEARIVVGPRSAVFAPLKDLGLIIIDEEHDASYKSGNAPRYHARQVAIKRCQLSGAALVMGSATPSLEAWKLMKDGAFRRLDLSRRLSGGSPPLIKLIDLAGTDSCLSAELKDEIRSCAQDGRQTILFLNRRGFSYFYRCPSCGYTLTCAQCSVSLTYHKAQNKAVCHYCGYSVSPPSSCPACGSLEAGFNGFGTELIEEETRRTFPTLSIRRVDADSVSKKGELKAVLDEFRQGHIDVLLGTQMVAKGLNFPGVRLVGVIFADTGLQLPDFRAAERTFALIVQVAGRAGRYFPDGRVLVQTFRPNEPAVALAQKLDIDAFYSTELERRAELGFPPYSRLIRVLARSKDAAKAQAAITRFTELVSSRLPRDADILGPAECPLAVIAGNARHHIILRSSQLSPLHALVRKAVEEYQQGRDAAVHLEIDIDPVNLL